MNKVKITVKELKEMMDIKDHDGFVNAWVHIVKNGFIFDEFKLYIDEMQQVYIVRINGKMEKQRISIIKNQNDDYGLLIKQMRYEFDVMGYLAKMNKFIKDETLAEKYKNSEFLDVVPVMSFMQYIIRRSRERTYEVVQSKEITSNKDKPKSRKKYKNKNQVYKLIDCIKIYEKKFQPHKKHEITCESWEVRGFFRHLKSGKVVWVNPYTKGKNKANKTSKNYIVGGDNK